MCVNVDGMWQEAETSVLGAKPVDGDNGIRIRDMPFNKGYPTAFLLGAMKSGSTSLGLALKGNGSMICRGNPVGNEPHFYYKEKHFFDSIESVTEGEQKFEWYKEHYSSCNHHAVLMDETPNYLCTSKKAPLLLKQVYQKMGVDVSSLRFLAVLREPSARATSHYKHDARMKELHKRKHYIKPWNLSCDDYFQWVLDHANREMDGIIGGCEALNAGRYAVQLSDWFEQFHPSQFMVMTMSQLVQDTDEVVKAIYTHLGASVKFYEFPGKLVKTNGGIDLVDDECHVMEELIQFYKPHQEALQDLKNLHPEAFYDVEDNPFTFETEEGNTEYEYVYMQETEDDL